MAEIKQIKVGSENYDLAAKYILDGSNLKQWSDITSLLETSFDIVVLSGTLPTANATTYETYHNSLVLCNNGETPETGTYVEWVITRTGSSGSYTYAWEKIGTSSADLSEYAKKTEAGAAGTYTSSTPSTNATGSADLGTATGTATVTYSKATSAATAGTHGHSVSASTEYTPAGSISTGSGTANYTPAGNITGSQTLGAHSHTVNASTGSFTAVTAVPTQTGSAGAGTANQNTGTSGALAVTFSTAGFSGTKKTLTKPTGAGSVKIDKHTFTPSGGISGSQSVGAHSHTATPSTTTVGSASGWSAGATASRATTTVVSGVGSSATVLTGVKSSGSANVNTDAIKSVTLSASTTSTDGPSYVQSFTHAAAALGNPSTVSVVTGYGSFSGGSLGTKNFGFTNTTNNVMFGPTVADGVLSWSVKNAATQDTFNAASLGTASTTTVVTGYPNFSGGGATPTTRYMKATGTAAGTTAVITGVTSNGTALAVTGLSTKDIWEITGTGTKPSLTVSDKTVVTGVSIGDGGSHTISGSNFSFSGDAVTLTHVQAATATTAYNTLDAIVGTTTEDYTPQGSITIAATAANHSHTYTAPAAHTHEIAASTTGSITYVKSATLGTTSGGTVDFTKASFGGTAVELKFSGSKATISVSGTAADAGGHTHTITNTDASATGSVSVALGSHTHTLGNHTHSVVVTAIA